MNLLFFDTETTGFPQKKLPLNDERQPRLVQLAMIEDRDDELLLEYDTIVKVPDGFEVPEASCAVHGITTQRSLSEGCEPEKVCEDFFDAIDRCDLIIAHNYSFDVFISNIQFARLGLGKCLEAIKLKPHFCTMIASMNICKLPGKYGSYKWPTLDEAYRILVDPAGFEGAHDALNDVRACRKVYYALKEREAAV